jgi:hypothetical protein
MWLRLIGGVFLCYLGVRTFLAKPAEQAASAEGAGLGSIYASTFFLTLTNPMTILAFAAIFAGLGLSSTGGDYLSAMLLVIGVFLGSALWWLLLSGGIGLFRNRFPTSGLIWVNRISGAIIVFTRSVSETGATLAVTSTLQTAPVLIVNWVNSIRGATAAIAGVNTLTVGLACGLLIVFSFIVLFTLRLLTKKGKA